MKRINTVIIVTSEFPPQPGGIGNHAFNLALFLSRESFSVTVLTDQRSFGGKDEEEFDKEQPFEVIRIKRYKWRQRMYVKRWAALRSIIKTADIVLASGKFSLWLVGWMKMSKSIYCMAIVHGSEVNYANRILNLSIHKSLNRFDHIVAVSNYTAKLLKQDKDKVSVIPNGIQVDSWKSQSDEINLKGHPKLITVGRLSKRKGQIDVIRHLPKLKEHFPEVHYHCIGIPQQADKYIELAEDLGVRDQLTIHGELEQKEMISTLACSDIFIMLSRETESGDVEGFGIAILEANALGIPAIGSRAMGITDAINDGYNGVLVDSMNSEEIIDAMDKILADLEKYRVSSREWATKHDWTQIVNEYIALFS